MIRIPENIRNMSYDDKKRAIVLIIRFVSIRYFETVLAYIGWPVK